jgi:hypothetical protein
VTTATPFALRQYREPHKIEPIEDRDPDLGLILRCSHDHLRVIGKVGGGFRHDPSEIAGLARIERGEQIRW